MGNQDSFSIQATISFCEARPGQVLLHCESSEIAERFFTVEVRDIREGTLSLLTIGTEAILTIDQRDIVCADYGPRYSICATTPLLDPQRFYFEFSRRLAGELGLPRSASSYLNTAGVSDAGALRKWYSLVQERMYLCMSGPQVVIDLALPLLEMQAVEYQVLPDNSHVPESNIWGLRFADFWCVAGSIDVRISAETVDRP